MKSLLSGVSFLLLCIYSLSPLSARAIIPPTPDDLAGESTLVCNGLVESVTTNGGEYNPSTVFTAKIKVLHIFKGEALSELEMHYENSSEHLPNGGTGIHLNKDGRYRFFLKKSSAALFYIPAHDGIDTFFSVEAIAPYEPDDAGYLTKKEVWEIAAKWLKDHHPELPPLIDPVQPPPGSPSAKLLLPCQIISQEYYNNGSYTLVISQVGTLSDRNRRMLINSNHTVNEQAWNNN